MRLHTSQNCKNDRVKYANIKRDPSISLIVDDPEARKYVVAYGRAEIIEKDYEDMLRLIANKYSPPERAEQMVQAITSDPSRVMVLLHPDKFVAN